MLMIPNAGIIKKEDLKKKKIENEDKKDEEF